MAQAENQAIGCQQQGPEQQRTFLPRPQNRKLVGRRQIAIAVLKNVGDREIVLKRRSDQHARSQQDNRESGDARPAGGFSHPVRISTG